jgi:hypothetical protein
VAFKARIKADGRLFIAVTEEPFGRDVFKLEADKHYWGHAFDSMPDETEFVFFSKSQWVKHCGAELEQLPGGCKVCL